MSFRKKIVLVLGNTGFLGSHVIKILRKKKTYKVFGASSSLGQNFLEFQKTCKFLKKIRPDYILNCASFGGSLHYVMKNPATIINNNAKIILNLYSSTLQLRKKPKIINAMANCSYAANVNIQKESNWLDGPVHDSVFSFGNITRMKYFVSKAWFDQYKTKSVNLIFGGLYGPNDHLEDHRLHAFDGIILRMTKAKMSGKKNFDIWGTGKPIREWIYIEDAAKAMVEAMKIKDNNPKPINVSQNLSLSINKIAEVAKKYLKFNCKIKHDLKFKDGAYKKILQRSKRYSQLFPNFKFTNFDESVKRTVKYYEEALKK